MHEGIWFYAQGSHRYECTCVCDAYIGRMNRNDSVRLMPALARTQSMEKTNVMRLLEQKKISYQAHTYEADATKSGEEIAALLGEDAERVFKTLVTRGKSGAFYVFVIPVTGELDLKKAASASGEKALSMIKQKELLPLTGYVHGGCSPIGMKKVFSTFFHQTAETYDTIYFSAGKVGFQVEVKPEDIKNILSYTLADLI